MDALLSNGNGTLLQVSPGIHDTRDMPMDTTVGVFLHSVRTAPNSRSTFP